MMVVPDPHGCTVQQRCSSTGRQCGTDDRACQSEAVANGLEVMCERVEPRAYVYCPPGAEQRDSGVVWILLAVAVGIAAFGAIAAYFMLFRKRSTS
ncbi:MAG: hypothetical protein BGO98_03635 [Myxococcales bacterium 68-20]|nr:hypothetical protein [Myxococcales bacterium]OJY25231.1 MAG: hypothetical protein BGO98_03635 [Myxococcales bacterium 68-20]